MAAPRKWRENGCLELASQVANGSKALLVRFSRCIETCLTDETNEMPRIPGFPDWPCYQDSTRLNSAQSRHVTGKPWFLSWKHLESFEFRPSLYSLTEIFHMIQQLNYLPGLPIYYYKPHGHLSAASQCHLVPRS